MSSPAPSGAAAPLQPAPERQIGQLQATAINMTQMCGIGPFVTIPAMVATIGGPEAMFGWVIGAILALADGLIWAELGAAPATRLGMARAMVDIMRSGQAKRHAPRELGRRSFAGRAVLA